MNANIIFDRLWVDYITQNPLVNEVYKNFESIGEKVENDHIAFRTVNIDSVNIEVLSRPFLDAGYVEKGTYIFESKHLQAKHFENPNDPLAPRVFISQLVLEDFSSWLKNILSEMMAKIPADKLQSDELIYSGNLWGVPSFSIYEKLRKESEYAAWFYVNGFRANHFTVSVNHLKTLSDIFAVNQFLKDKGFALNTSGGEVKGTAEELLRQSSILAGDIPITFIEGVKHIPGCYYEFAERFKDNDGKLYSGFIAKSADKIFESTDYKK